MTNNLQPTNLPCTRVYDSALDLMMQLGDTSPMAVKIICKLTPLIDDLGGVIVDDIDLFNKLNTSTAKFKQAQTALQELKIIRIIPIEGTLTLYAFNPTEIIKDCDDETQMELNEKWSYYRMDNPTHFFDDQSIAHLKKEIK